TPTRSPSARSFRIVPPAPNSASSGCGAITRTSSTANLVGDASAGSPPARESAAGTAATADAVSYLGWSARPNQPTWTRRRRSGRLLVVVDQGTRDRTGRRLRA